jgi:hypothetical protein
VALTFLAWPLSYAFFLGLSNEKMRVPTLVALVIVVGVSIAAGVYTWRHSGYRSGPPPRSVPGKEAVRGGAIGAGVGALLRVAGIGAPFILLGAVLMVGPLIALLLRITFVRELPAERRARERLATLHGTELSS